ncbi:MAG: DUF4494 domain-containing protein [Bacteroidota bacterium]
MNTWFTCKIKYQKIDEKGKAKNVSEAYLVDAVSFTEAERRIYEKMETMIQGEFYVTGIAKARLSDVFYYEDSDLWHRCKMTYTLEEEGSGSPPEGKEKKITNYVLLTAPNVKEAYDRMYQSLNNMLVDFRVTEIVESPIVEVFPYDSEEEDTKFQEAPDNYRPLSEVNEDQAV